MTNTSTMVKPPKGVLAGSSVPRENEESDRMEREVVDRMVAEMKKKKEYREIDDGRLREIAKEKLL